MATHDDLFVPESAGPRSTPEGEVVSETTPEPTRLPPASPLANTIELGRRVTELVDKLRAHPGASRRTSSFRLIAKQLDAPKGASSVWRAAAIYQLAQQYPELYEYQHLGVGHLAVLLSLRGPLQLALLRRAERMRWSRRKLEAKVKHIRDSRDLELNPALLAEIVDDKPSQSDSD